MLETQATVIATEPGFAWVESARHGACGSCSAQGSCGTRMLGEALAPAATSQVRVRDPLGVQVGEQVVIGMNEQNSLRAAFMLYGLPLVGLMLGLLIGQTWGDLVAVLLGAGGMLLALLLVHGWSLRQQERHEAALQPIILTRLASSTAAACTTHPVRFARPESR